MTDTFRAMCAELVRRWDAANGDHDLIDVADAMDRARTLLAQPEPEGLTDEELDRSERRCWKRGSSIEIEPEGIREVWDRDETFDHRAYARAVIAADRARRPTPQPPAEGEVAEMQRWGVNHGAQPGRPLLSPMEDGYWTPWHIAADLLQRLASDNAGLEAAAESAYLDNLSLLDSQND